LASLAIGGLDLEVEYLTYTTWTVWAVFALLGEGQECGVVLIYVFWMIDWMDGWMGGSVDIWSCFGRLVGEVGVQKNTLVVE